MIQDAAEYDSRSVQRYINPDRIPTTKKIQIFESDPRNNYSFLQLMGESIEVIPDPISDLEATGNEVMDFFSEATSNNFNLGLDNDLTIPTNSDSSHEDIFTSTLSIPTNLYLDTNSYRLEDGSSAGDGTVKFVASLYFDDVLGAESYDYTLNASES